MLLTPNGRFETDRRLCLSMSDYHPESWNPSWSVETLLVGLQSFMYEESNAIGSISAYRAERERLGGCGWRPPTAPLFPERLRRAAEAASSRSGGRPRTWRTGNTIFYAPVPKPDP